MNYQLTGVFGGTFDPIHCGHLAVAEYLSQHLPLSKIHFIPCLQPPHRAAPIAAPQHRLEMVKLAIADHPNWIADDSDFQRPAPSYMVDTLTQLRQRQPNTAWCLILGMDVYSQLNQWREWEKILTLAHLIIVNRPGIDFPTAGWSQELLARSQIKSAEDLSSKPTGNILFQPIPPSPISATAIRRNIQENPLWLPPAVSDYIQKHALYQNSSNPNAKTY